MTRAGDRYHRIAVERATVTTDSYNEEVRSWVLFTEAYAQIRWGSGDQRMQAAQEGGVQAVTFIVMQTPDLRAVTITDRIVRGDEMWNIVAIADGRQRGEIEFTARRDV